MSIGGRLWHAFMGLLTGKAEGLTHPRQLGISLIIATIPVMLVGFTFADAIKTMLFHPLVVAVMLIIGGLLIFYVENRPKPIIADEAEQIDFKTALKNWLISMFGIDSRYIPLWFYHHWGIVAGRIPQSFRRIFLLSGHSCDCRSRVAGFAQK